MSHKPLKIIERVPTKLLSKSLPTNQDVIRAIHFIKRKEDKTYKEAIKSVIESIVNIWNRASLPIVNIKTITDKLSSYHQNYLTLSHSDSTRKNHKAKVNKFKVCVYK